MLDVEVRDVVRDTGVWRLGVGAPVLIEASAEGPAVVIVPTEAVLLLAVDLPLPNRRQRLAALPFAIEDRLAEPIEATHIVLGDELAPRRHLAAAVRLGIMREWADRLALDGFAGCRLVPDVFLLPPPPPGFWTVQLTAGRMLVRTNDCGFAAPLDLFRLVWAAEGHPPLAAVGDVPADLSDAPPVVALGGLAERLRAPPIDLRQGAFAPPVAQAPRALRLFWSVCAFALFAHAALAVAEVVRLQNLADDRRAEAVGLLQAAAPGATLDSETIGRLERIGSADGGAGGFLPLMARTLRAAEPLAPTFALQNVAYSRPDGVLAMKVDASDLAALQRLESALDSAGLRPVSGSASTEAGRAEGEISVRDPEPGPSR